MSCRRLLQILLVVTFASAAATAAESEGCLNCHQYQGLSRVDDSGKRIAEFYVNPSYYNHGLGPHARLKCTDCHVRNDVEVFPHKVQSKVDCTRACHLDSPGGLATRFSHQPVSRMLTGSVHKPATLGKSNLLLGAPISTRQSECLLCHGEPVFRRNQTWMTEDAAIQKCNTCHDDSLPRDTRFGFWHVHARSTPMRAEVQTIRTCATCHSNETVRAEFKLPDSTASFLAGYHGKAVLLGSENTADCLHCHAGLGQNVHAMLKVNDPLSPTAPGRLAETCRTAGCHGTAGARLSTAAVHLDIASTGGIEFYIGCLFIAIIAFTFGPSLLLTAMKLFHHVLGRHDPEHHHHWHLAEALLAKTHTREKLIRFQAHQRVQHWLLAVSFTLLCLTGFPMKFADRAWAAWMISQFGGLAAARTVHRAAGTILIFGVVYHMAYILRIIWQTKKTTGRSFVKTLRSMPMAISPGDATQMLQLILYYSFLRKTKPASHRFGPEEKFEYVGVFWGSMVLGATGILLWANTWTSRLLPGRVLTIAALLHTFEAFLALLHIGVVHMTHVIFSPTVFPLSKAMFTGHTPKDKLVRGHGGLLKELAAEHGVTVPAKEASNV